MLIRDETGDDAAAIRRVTVAAFGREAEADLVGALRAGGDAAISLVAEDDAGIVGHILLSKLRSPAGCVALAPVSVAPDRQNRGVGSSLVRDGLARARRDGWLAVFVVGEPDYYGRFGFHAATAERFEAEYPKPYVMALELTPRALAERQGAVIFAPPFLALDPA